MAERILNGLLRDTFGRLIVTTAISAAALAEGEKISNGFVRDKNKRMVIVGVGGEPLGNIAPGTQNTYGGKESLASVTTGEGDTAYGYHALKANATPSFCTAIGWGALEHNVGGGGFEQEGNQNTAVG